MNAAVHTAVGNPFCTRHVRPGRLPSLDEAGRPVDLARVLTRLADIDGSGAIVGPHGSGKTTLLGHLADALEAEGRRVVRKRISRASDAVALLATVARTRHGDIVCVDSWERLGWPWALVVRWCAAAARARLLVTAHRIGPLPTLWQCTTTPAVLGAIVARLPCGDPAARLIDEIDMQHAFRRASGNVREALFLLYDTFEARSRAGRGSTV